MKRTFEGAPLLTVFLLADAELEILNHKLSRAAQDGASAELIAAWKQEIDEVRAVIDIIETPREESAN